MNIVFKSKLQKTITNCHLFQRKLSYTYFIIENHHKISQKDIVDYQAPSCSIVGLHQTEKECSQQVADLQKDPNHTPTTNDCIFTKMFWEIIYWFYLLR